MPKTNKPLRAQMRALELGHTLVVLPSQENTARNYASTMNFSAGLGFSVERDRDKNRVIITRTR